MFGETIGLTPGKRKNTIRYGTKLQSVSPSISTNLNLLDYLLIIFPMDPHVSENEFIKWLGMWLVMGCYKLN